MSEINILLSPEVLASTLKMMIPLLLVSLAGLLAKQAGIENIGLEGLMLIGCFGAFVFDYYTESWVFGLLGGMLCSMVIAMIFGFFVITLRAHEIVAGVAINSLGLGLTTYFLRIIFGVKGSISDPRVVAVPSIKIGFMEGVPVIGRIFNNLSILVPISIALVFVVHFVLYHTRFGYYIRASGENKEALVSVGIPVNRIRYYTIFCHGLLCGLGGAYLSIGYLTQYVINMSAGRGFIAMAAYAFGSAIPFRVFGASILFAFVESLSNRLQSINVPSYFALMIPYIVTVIVLAVTSYRGKRRKRSVSL